LERIMENQSFGSVTDLISSFQTPGQVAAPTAAISDADLTPEQMAVQQAQEAIAQQSSTTLPQELAQPVSTAVQSTTIDPVAVIPAAPATPVKAEVKPTLEATLAEDVEADEKDPNRMEVVNLLLDAMQELFAQRKAQGAGAQVDKIRNILNNVSVDVDAIVPVKADNPLPIQQQLQIINTIDASPSFPVIALKSGYRLSFKALNNNDKIAVRNFRGTPYDQTIKLLKLVFSKIAETSVGSMKFADFLNVTADEDYETLLYGIYYPTFPQATEYTVQCPHCAAKNNVKLLPDTLIEVVDQEKAGTYVADVLQGVNRGREFLSNSMVAKTKRIILPDSRIVIELLTPTLQRMLDNMSLTQKFAGKFEDEIIVLHKYIKQIMVPDVEAFSRGQVRYYEVSDIHQILPSIANLSAGDLKVLNKAISDRIRQYRVQYRIPAFNCAGDTCKKLIENIDVDITSLLFFAIAEATSV
jgi:hypothetical protein